MLTGNLGHFTGYDQRLPETESAIDQTYRLLICLTGSQKEEDTLHDESVYVCVCVCVCVFMMHCLMETGD